MASKLQFYADLADNQTRQVTGSRENWTGFLETAGRLYKYPFEEQLMIYAQRPNATACAELETWNKPMNRFVKRGSKGIALIDQTSGKPRLRYVFDVSDTQDGRYNSHRPFLWELKPEHEAPVMEALNKAYDVSDNDLGDILFGLAQSLSARYYEDNTSDINYSVEGSFLEDYDEFNVEMAFREALTVSTAYSLMTRCGIDPADYIEDEDFQPIFDFNSPTSVYALGKAVSTVSGEVLREIGITVKKYEQAKAAERGNEHERTHLQSERGLSDTRHSDTGNDRAAGQIRNDAEELSGQTPSDNLHDIHDAGEIVPPLHGDRENGEREIGIDDSAVDGTDTAARQSDRPDSVGSAYEQPESTGGGNYFERVDLQLNTEIEDEAPSVMGGVSASKDTISDNEINTFLTDGSGVQDGKYRIFSFFLHEHSVKEKADFLKHEYGTGGRTHAIPGADHSYADYDSKGLMLKKGDISNPDVEISLTWTNVANRIDNLINENLYMSQSELDRLPRYERQMLGAGVINFFSNLPLDIPRPALTESGVFGDYWGNATKIGDTLDSPGAVAELLTAMRPIMENTPTADRYYDTRKTAFDNLTAFENGTFTLFPQLSAVQMNFESPIETPLFSTPTATASQLSLFPTEQEQIEAIREAEQIEIAAQPVTITQDDIDNALRNWNGSIDSKIRVYEYMHENARARETAHYLTSEYDGGRTAFTVTKDGTEPVVMPWAKVQRRIAQLMDAELFLSADEQALVIVKDNAEWERLAEENTAPETEQIPIEATEQAPTAPDPVPYAVGDTVYLENDRKFIIEEITRREVKVLDTNLYIPITRLMDIDHFEQEYYRNPKNEIEPPVAETTERDIPVHEPQIETEIMPEPPRTLENFRITDTYLGEGGAKTKFNNNVEAIKLLQAIEFENRAATPDEQEILSRYVGWGGLPQAFDPDNKQWENEYLQLNALLSPEEYESARASTLNAHYTSPTVIKAIYDTVGRLGFMDGNILEPSCGVGNFFGLLPDSMKNAKLYGVELDSVTGRIAKQLYPNADIKIAGFEKTNMPDSFFDVAIGNVPFGSYKVMDRKYDKQNFLVHDYFFGKALDQVRPGGIVAFITSKGTLDKQNPEVRKYIAQRAELLGAVRLPNTAFLKNAGTEVTSDIIFLQKRDRLIDVQPDWVHLGMMEDGLPLNSYFAENPHMMLGTMTTETTQYGHDTTCKPIPGADLAEQLKTALSHIQGAITEMELDDIEGIQDVSIPADPAVRNFSYTLVDDTVYFREDSRMRPVDLPAATLERVKGMVELRDSVHALIDFQLHDYPDYEIKAKQSELNELYDKYSRKFGLINDSANNKAFQADSAYYLLSSLEILDENGKLERKSDMFTKRTIKQKTVITSVDTASEALAVSIAQKAKVDIDFMQDLTGFSEDRIIADLQGVIFRDLGEQPPEDVPKAFYDLSKRPFVTADEYLSGNVRNKLRLAKGLAEMRADLADPIAVNISALEQAQPTDLEAGEISVRLGSTWIDKAYIQEFMFELLQTPRYLRYEMNVNYSQHTGEWNITGKGRASYSDVLATVTYGTERMNAYKIIEDTLNLKDVRVYDTKIVDGKETRVLNKKETTLAGQKQEAIKQEFKDWIFRDSERRQDLVSLYNERFNSTRPREFDGSHIEFTGITPEIKLKPHQTGAIARILYGGNTLLAHEVGAGKTFEMVGAAMEAKRLGLCQKSLMAVPNHLTEQMASEFLRLYPSANILVATKKEFNTKSRKKFCAKIATGDYDAVIIGHSQLEKIPLSKERQERLLNEQIWEITDGIDELKRNNGERFSIKQLEKTKKSLEARLEKLTDDSRKDTVVTFEQLGVDRLFVDESHNFKNLFLYTKMRNVAGLSTSEAQKSSDMFMKCRYMDEITDGKGVIFATGTPVTNSMTELYTVQRYLQFETLQKKNMVHFDAWASTFGETQTSVELSPEGSGYRARTRFAKFQNLPELMNMFGEVADIKTADTLDLERPEAIFQTVVVKPTDIQKEMVAELSERAKDVHNKVVAPEIDNMLKITSDGRKIGLDQRLMNPMLPDDPSSKVNACMENIYRIWEETADNRLAQLCFCDFSTPNKDGRFNVYDDIKGKLLAKGVPEDELAFIHDTNTEAQKKELFAKVRSGKVRVLFGSTFKMGAGTNVQDRLIALHDLDCPWRPADLTQRLGRILRQGNKNPEVSIFRYVTEGTFDSYLFQTVEKKQEFISQIMTSKSPVRSCDDVDEEALSYAEIKALCAGNPLIKEKMNLDIEVAKLKLLKGDHQSQHYRLQDDLLKSFPKRIETAKANIAGFKDDIARLETNTHRTEEGISPMTIGSTTYTDRGAAGAALLDACKDIKTTEPIKIGSYRGLDMLISFDSFNKEFNVAMKGAMTHTAPLGNDSFGNITRINNAFDKIPQRLTSVEAHLQTLHEQVGNAKTELDKPFPFEQDLTDKSARLAELDSMLNMDDKPDAEQENEHETYTAAAKREPMEVSAKSKPSVLETLKVNAEKSRQMFGGKTDTEKSKEISI